MARRSDPLPQRTPRMPRAHSPLHQPCPHPHCTEALGCAGARAGLQTPLQWWECPPLQVQRWRDCERGCSWLVLDCTRHRPEQLIRPLRRECPPQGARGGACMGGSALRLGPSGGACSVILATRTRGESVRGHGGRTLHSAWFRRSGPRGVGGARGLTRCHCCGIRWLTEWWRDVGPHRLMLNRVGTVGALWCVGGGAGDR